MSKFLIAVLLGLVGCTAPGKSVRLEHQSEATVSVSGKVSAPPGLGGTPQTGNLAVYWLTPVEFDDLQNGRHVIRTVVHVMERTQSFAAVDLSKAPVQFSSMVSPGPVLLFGILDRKGEFLATLMQEGGAGNLVGMTELVNAGTASTTEVRLVLGQQVPEHPVKERCSGERLRLERVRAPQVAGARGTSVDRRLCVYLPPSYEANPARKYPVIYSLPGLSSRDTGGKFFEIGQNIKALAPLGVEAIVVGVDTQSRWGSTYLTSSPTAGDFESFLARDVVQFVDQHYRTRAEPSERALVGHSTGGFNAISFALRYPDVFQVAVASSPDALDLENWLFGSDGKAKAPILAWMRVEDTFGPPGQMVSYAADWSPNGKGGFRWPVRLDTGERISEVWQQWKAASPIEMLKQPAIRDAAKKSLSRRIYITASPSDEAWLFEPARRFSEALTDAGIVHTFATDNHGHFTDERRVREMVFFTLSAFKEAASESDHGK